MADDRSSNFPTFTANPSGVLAAIPGMSLCPGSSGPSQPTVLPDTGRQARILISELKGLSGVDEAVQPRPGSSLPSMTDGGRTLSLDQYHNVIRSSSATVESAATQMTDFLVKTQTKAGSLNQASQDPHGHQPLYAQSLGGNSYIYPSDPSRKAQTGPVQATADLWSTALDVESKCAVNACQALVSHMKLEVKSDLAGKTCDMLRKRGIDAETAQSMVDNMVPTE
ncbi:hypothetical protein IAT40_002072 [Kwoniella sp. CBS 6097]